MSELDFNISHSKLLRESDKTKVLSEWNNTKTVFSADSLSSYLERWAREAPDRVALEYADKQYTYKQLNDIVCRVSAYLSRQGIRANKIVAVYLAKTDLYFIALLSIIRLGAVYVPLGLNNKPAYVRSILDEIEADCLLVADELSIASFSFAAKQILLIDDELFQKSDLPIDKSITNIENAQYINYTSGSTGLPKGVLVTQKSLLNLLLAMKSLLSVGSDLRLLSVTNISFDIVYLEFFLPLIVGGQLVIATEEELFDLNRLAQCLKKKSINLMQATPTFWEALLFANHPLPGDLIILCGGEKLSETLAKEILSREKGFWNLYGPTETTVWSAAAYISNLSSLVTIGRPIANTQIYLLNQCLEPVAVGEPGEIYIAGVGLAEGYYKNPGMTNQHFLENPFLTECSSRMYKTGDVAYYLKTGEIVFVGRLDREVKLRGFRINLEGIESLINQYPGIIKSAVLLESEQRIKAYVKASGKIEKTDLLRDLSEYLADRLPKYMLPQSIDFLDNFPLTANKKINYKKIFELSITTTEKTLLDVWKEVFGNDNISLDDNFFSLGGSSITAMKIAARIDAQLHYILSMSDVFAHPTIAKLAEGLDAGVFKESHIIGHVNSLRKESLEAEASFLEVEVYYSEGLSDVASSNNIPVLVKINGDLDVDILAQAVDRFIKLQEIFWFSYLEKNNKLIKIKCKQPSEELAALRCEKLNEADLAFSIEAFFEQKISLDNPPLAKFKLLEISGDEYYLLMLFHHIYTDDWTLRVLLRDFEHCYESVSQGDAYQNELLRADFDFNVLHKKKFNSLVKKAGLKFWQYALLQERQNFAESLLFKKELGDRFANSQTVIIPPDLLGLMKSFSANNNQTIFVILFSALRLLFYFYTHEKNSILAVPVNLREGSDALANLGLFTNVLPINVPVKFSESFLSIVKSTEKFFAEASQHKFFPVGDILSDVYPVTFNFEDEDIRQLRLGDCEVSFGSYCTKGSNFPLSIFAKFVKNNLQLEFKYLTKVFDERFISSLKSHFLDLLPCFLKQPKQAVEALDFLTITGELEKIKQYGRIDSAVDYAASNIVALFGEQVKLHPLSVAVKDSQRQISYQQLDKLTDQIAANLIIDHEVKSGDIVAVMLLQSMEVLVCFLAILKAGAAYLYCDNEMPQQRLEHILTQSGARCLISSTRNIALNNFNIKFVDYALLNKKQESSFDISKINITANTPAYVIYTSGSTGLPKGVLVEHKSVVTLAKNKVTFSIKSDFNVAQAADLSFDASVLEIWGALLNGACLKILKKQVLLDAEKLQHFIVSEAINFLFLTTNLFHELVRLKPSAFNALNYLVVGGDRLNQAAVNLLFSDKNNQALNLVNGYGPTETTCFACCYPVSYGASIPLNIPIGFSLNGRKIIILGKDFNLLPVGGVGEICIAGEGVARAYLGDVKKSESFVTLKLPGLGAAPLHLYRTGDYGRFNHAGELIFLGRGDRQIKRNGYRVELAEIEASLLSIAGVSFAVLTTEESEDSTRIQAWVSLSGRVKQDSQQQIRKQLAALLPAYMLPDEFHIVDEFPLNKVGKVDLKSLRQQYAASKDIGDHQAEEGLTPVEQEVLSAWQEVLGHVCSVDDNFFDVGGTSLLVLKVYGSLRQQYGDSLKVSDLFEFYTPRKLAEHLSKAHELVAAESFEFSSKAKLGEKQASKSGKIAIIGMSGKFPGAENLSQFWEMLLAGKQGVRHFDAAQLKSLGVPEAFINLPNYRGVSGFLDDLFLFDAEFFNFSPKYAEYLDPHHRISLQLAWAAVEDAGYALSRYKGRVGVFCGMSESAYQAKQQLREYPLYSRKYNTLFNATNRAFLATTISYKLGLTGPAINLDTGCSTGLVSVVEACKSLLAGECDMALAGAISLLMPEQLGYLYEREHIFSEVGACLPFSDKADGIVPSVGAGMVLCKPLEQVVKDGDNILAVIDGFAINNDGDEKVGFSAPSVVGQERCIVEAQKKAGINSSQVSYIETHGTATKLGDAIEFQALKASFSHNSGKQHSARCTLGSVKYNIGHTNYASGIASLIKTVLMLQHKTIPPMPYFQHANQSLGIEESNFHINNKPEPLGYAGLESFVGVSSFGIGGTNAHVILSVDASPVQRPVVRSKDHRLLLISAKTEKSLQAYREKLLAHLQGLKLIEDDKYFVSLVNTLMLGREHFSCRLAFICNNLSGAIEALKTSDGRFVSGESCLALAANAWIKGGAIDCKQFSDEWYKKISLPTYVFSREQYIFTARPEKLTVEENPHTSQDQAILDKLKNEWQRILGVKDLGLQQDFFDLGGDSLLAIDIVVFFEKEFCIQLELEELLYSRTIEKQAEIVKKSVFQKRQSVCVKLGGLRKSQPPIVFVHPIGGSLFCFLPLASALSKSNLIFGLQDPLMCGSFQKFSSVEQTATYYLSELKKIFPDEDYLLAGYSSGGTIAFELLRQLKASGKSVNRLIMFDAWAHFPEDIASVESLKGVMERQIDSLKLNLFPEFQSNREEWFETLGNRLSILLQYQPVKMDVDIMLFKSQELFAEYIVLQDYSGELSDSNGWERYANSVQTVMTPGHHEELLRSANVSMLQQSIAAYINFHLEALS